MKDGIKNKWLNSMAKFIKINTELKLKWVVNNDSWKLYKLWKSDCTSFNTFTAKMKSKQTNCTKTFMAEIEIWLRLELYIGPQVFLSHYSVFQILYYFISCVGRSESGNSLSLDLFDDDIGLFVLREKEWKKNGCRSPKYIELPERKYSVHFFQKGQFAP